MLLFTATWCWFFETNCLGLRLDSYVNQIQAHREADVASRVSRLSQLRLLNKLHELLKVAHIISTFLLHLNIHGKLYYRSYLEIMLRDDGGSFQE